MERNFFPFPSLYVDSNRTIAVAFREGAVISGVVKKNEFPKYIACLFPKTNVKVIGDEGLRNETRAYYSVQTEKGDFYFYFLRTDTSHYKNVWILLSSNYEDLSNKDPDPFAYQKGKC